MTVWQLIFNVISFIVDGMTAVDIMYGISIWNLFIIFTVLTDLGFIVSAIFGGEANGDDN